MNWTRVLQTKTHRPITFHRSKVAGLRLLETPTFLHTVLSTGLAATTMLEEEIPQSSQTTSGRMTREGRKVSLGSGVGRCEVERSMEVRKEREQDVKVDGPK